MGLTLSSAITEGILATMCFNTSWSIFPSLVIGPKSGTSWNFITLDTCKRVFIIIRDRGDLSWNLSIRLEPKHIGIPVDVRATHCPLISTLELEIQA